VKRSIGSRLTFFWAVKVGTADEEDQGSVDQNTDRVGEDDPPDLPGLHPINQLLEENHEAQFDGTERTPGHQKTNFTPHMGAVGDVKDIGWYGDISHP
jgi:hypothetical protein